MFVYTTGARDMSIERIRTLGKHMRTYREHMYGHNNDIITLFEEEMLNKQEQKWRRPFDVSRIPLSLKK